MNYASILEAVKFEYPCEKINPRNDCFLKEIVVVSKKNPIQSDSIRLFGLLYFAKSDILRNLNEIDILRNYDEGKLYFAKLEF